MKAINLPSPLTGEGVGEGELKSPSPLSPEVVI